jgi:hypothetical protein
VYVQVKATRVTGAAAGGDVLIEARIDPRSVYFTMLEGRRVARLGIGIFCGDSQRAVVGELWQEMNLALTDLTYEQFKQDGIPYTAHIAARGLPKYVKVVVYDRRSDRVGARTTKVK